MACEATCKKCTSKGDAQVTIQNMYYNTTGYYPDDLVEIRVTVKNNNMFFHSDVCACLFDGESVISTLYQDIPSGGLTYEFIFPTFTMGSINRTMHLSIISGTMFYDCTDYRNFTLKVLAPPGEGYRCDPILKDCVSDTTSNVPYDTCLERCRGGGGGGGCDSACVKGSTCLLGTCVKNNDILIASAGILAFVYLTKKG